MDSKFVDCLKTIVQSDNDYEVVEAWKNLEEMENVESGSKNSVYNYNTNYDKLLRSILTNESIKNIDQVPHLLEWFSKFPNTASNPISDDISLFLQKSAESFKVKPCLAEIIQVINDNEKKYLSANNENLCKAIIEALSWMNESGDTRKYNEDLIKIREFLKMICKRSTNDESSPGLTFICFKTMCSIFLESDREDKNISSALIIVFQLIEEQLWNEHMSIAVQIILTAVKLESKITKMLSMFCEWLVLPSNNYMEYLSMWLTLFIKALEKENMHRISKEVAEITLPSIFSKSLTMENFYSININNNIVLLLLERISSLALHHKIMHPIHIFLTTLKNDNDPKKEEVVYAIKKITKNLLLRFTQHLEGCSTCAKLGNLETFVNNSNYSSQIPEDSEEMEISYPSTSSGFSRFDNVKVGLVNLGNTCYMNSVLQALAMTSQFCHEVLLYKTTNDLSNQTVLKNLQNLFALLKYTEKNSLSPTEILRASRPSYFMPGHQQDSSEFLCHLLDVMYEQEKSAFVQNSSTNESISMKLKVEDKEMVDVEEVTGALTVPMNDDGTSQNMYRWTTEENLCEGASLQRKTQSLADFTQGEELAQTQNALSDSHSDSTDSGIQSVGGEDSTSSSASSTSSPSAVTLPSSTLSTSSSYLVHRVFGGELKVTYRCITCDTESDNTDKFRDLQLCFLDNLPSTETIKVQDLIDVNYFLPENLTGDNKYRCDKCEKLCDAQRIIKILQTPEHLILTLKHFRYDSESRLRTKLRRKVLYNETIEIPVFEHTPETFQLYAAVVHSGYNMDYGHYITYACDARRRWYKFNDNYVSESSIEEFNSLEPPDTPYILFYKRCSDTTEAEAPDFSVLCKSLQDYVEQNRPCMEDYRTTGPKIRRNTTARYKPDVFRTRDGNDDEDDNPPPSNCRDALTIPQPRYLC